MIRKNTSDEATLDLAEFLPAELDHQLARRQAALILQIIIEVPKPDTELLRHQPPDGALSRPRWPNQDQNRPADHVPKPPSSLCAGVDRAIATGVRARWGAMRGLQSPTPSRIKCRDDLLVISASGDQHVQQNSSFE
jgi:hypothetical protein